MKYLITLSFLLIFSCNFKKETEINNITLDSKEEINAIKRILKKQKNCWNNGDIDGFMKGYWQSDKLIFTSAAHKPAYGWENTKKRYKNSYPNKENMGELNYDIIDIKIISEKTAILNGKWELIRNNDHPKGKFWLELKSFNGEWVITKDSTVSIIN